MLEREKKKDTWHIKTKNTCFDSKCTCMYINFKKKQYFEILI